MKKNTIISLADSNYFNLLNELIDSINRFEQSNEIDICIMDAGLTEDQIKVLEKKFNSNNVIVAYEPIRSIGTGEIPTTEELNKTIIFIKKVLII